MTRRHVILCAWIAPPLLGGMVGVVLGITSYDPFDVFLVSWVFTVTSFSAAWGLTLSPIAALIARWLTRPGSRPPPPRHPSPPAA